MATDAGTGSTNVGNVGAANPPNGGMLPPTPPVEAGDKAVKETQRVESTQSSEEDQQITNEHDRLFDEIFVVQGSYGFPREARKTVFQIRKMAIVQKQAWLMEAKGLQAKGEADLEAKKVVMTEQAIAKLLPPLLEKVLVPLDQKIAELEKNSQATQAKLRTLGAKQGEDVVEAEKYANTRSRWTLLWATLVLVITAACGLLIFRWFGAGTASVATSPPPPPAAVAPGEATKNSPEPEKDEAADAFKKLMNSL